MLKHGDTANARKIKLKWAEDLKKIATKMRLYSNTLLSWPQSLHLFQVARLYPGRWQNYYFYKINRVEPYVLTTYSPIEFLQENCKYYCYDKYYRDKRLEDYGNRFEMISLDNKEPEFGVETWGYLPKVAGATDMIVIRNDTAAPGYPSVIAPPFISTLAAIPPLLQ